MVRAHISPLRAQFKYWSSLMATEVNIAFERTSIWVHLATFTDTLKSIKLGWGKGIWGNTWLRWFEWGWGRILWTLVSTKLYALQARNQLHMKEDILSYLLGKNWSQPSRPIPPHWGGCEMSVSMAVFCFFSLTWPSYFYCNSVTNSRRWMKFLPKDRTHSHLTCL